MQLELVINETTTRIEITLTQDKDKNTKLSTTIQQRGANKSAYVLNTHTGLYL